MVHDAHGVRDLHVLRGGTDMGTAQLHAAVSLFHLKVLRFWCPVAVVVAFVTEALLIEVIMRDTLVSKVLEEGDKHLVRHFGRCFTCLLIK